MGNNGRVCLSDKAYENCFSFLNVGGPEKSR